MVFKCQEDSFLKQFTSTVISCEKGILKTVVNGKETNINGFEIKCENTILFPEGGGQPSDKGYLHDIEVLQVTRRGTEAIHFTLSPLDIGSKVKQHVDWDRRFDHMQQHSGQHLLSSILERFFNYNTDSWWLGEEVSYVELDTPKLTSDDIMNVEEMSNDLIEQSLPVTVKVYKEGDSELNKATTRGLPEDHKGDIRVISIGDIDNNMCCGTHVSNLSQLQMIKILYAEKGKRKNKTTLYFLVGKRVLKRLTKCIIREQQLTSLLNNGATKHVELVDKLLKNVKSLNKNVQTLSKDIISYEVVRIKSSVPSLKYFCFFRKDIDQDALNAMVREIGDTHTLLFLCCGDEKDVGNMILYGKESIIKDLGPRICELLDGKGFGKGTRYQAKVNNMGNRPKCEELIKSYFH